MKSICRKLNKDIVFPEYKQDVLLYMYKTNLNNIILPKSYENYIEAINQMLFNIENKNDCCYITIDHKCIKSGNSHRRGGAHFDGNWIESSNKHNIHKLNCLNNSGKWTTDNNTWKYDLKNDTGGMLLSSNYAACQVWNGYFNGNVKSGGDCSEIDLSNMKTEVIPENTVYFLNQLGIHESLPINQSVNRALIRINFHADYNNDYLK